MKRLINCAILSFILMLFSCDSTSQTPYQDFIKPNAIGMKNVEYSVLSGDSLTYLSNNSTGDTYILWVTQTPTFTPPLSLPVGWSVATPFYRTGAVFHFDPIDGWPLLMDENNNVWLKVH